MDFNKVISMLESDPGDELIATSYDEDSQFFRFYLASNDMDDPEWISVLYEGGRLFSTEGEEDSYSIDDLPPEVRSMKFQKYSSSSSCLGCTAEYKAYLLFPELPDPESLVSAQDKKLFSQQLAAILSDKI